MAKRVGIADVALAAGVSVTTVSHALSGQGKLSESTRARVIQIAGELGYAPNRIASALRRQRSGIVGLVSDAIATTPFAGRIILGAQDSAAKHGLLLMVVNSNRDELIERNQIDSLLAQQVDGIVYARMSHRIVRVPPGLEQLPTVVVDAETEGAASAWVVPDEERIGRDATQRLIAAGHRTVAHITVDEAVPGVSGRISGYLSAMADAGLTPQIMSVPGPADARAGREAFEEAIDAEPETTAVFAFNDQMAMGVYQVASQRSIQIPADLSVVGVDNLEVIAGGLLPALTTVALPHYEMGYWAIDQLATMIGNPTWEAERPHVQLVCPLVERDSVGAAPVR